MKEVGNSCAGEEQTRSLVSGKRIKSIHLNNPLKQACAWVREGVPDRKCKPPPQLSRMTQNRKFPTEKLLENFHPDAKNSTARHALGRTFCLWSAGKLPQKVANVTSTWEAETLLSTPSPRLLPPPISEQLAHAPGPIEAAASKAAAAAQQRSGNIKGIAAAPRRGRVRLQKDPEKSAS